MKKKIISLLSLCACILVAGITPVTAQTTMAPGDMAVIGLNCTNDAVSWVTFVDICPCTVFYLSDDPYKNATGYCTSAEEHCIKITVTALFPAGTILTYDDSHAYPTVGAVTCMPNNGAATAAYSDIAIAGTNPGFNSNGDNVLFFQGSYSAPNFICGLMNNANWNAAGTVVCSNKNHCELPSTLTNGVNALCTNQCQGMVYNCTLTSGSATTLASAINNSANWSCNVNNDLTVPPPCSFSVTAPKPCFSCQLNDTICPGQSTTLLAQGSGINVKWYNSLSGGSPIYTGSSFSTPVLSSTTTYYVTQTSSGVESAPRVPITVTTLPQPNAGPDKSISCIALPGGSINMAATGAGTWTAMSGNPGTATIANSTTPTTAITTFSAAGTYHFIWTNNKGCTDTAAVVITQAANASIATPAQLTCSVATVTLTANSTTTGATYNWGGGNTAATLAVNAANTYTVTVTNPVGGCTATASAMVSSTGSPISITAAPTAATCGFNNGSATVSVTTGTGPYTYSWSNNSTTQTINNLTANTYAVTVSGQGGCSATASANVTATGGLSLTPSSTATTCGNNNGTAGIAATGTGPFTYSWSNGATIATLANLNPGTYSVSVSGVGGCSATASMLVDTSSAVTIAAYGGRAGCTSSGTVSVNVNTGTGPFTYLWSNNGTTSSINSLSAGNYSVTVTGAAGCSASTTVTVISTGTGVSLSTSASASACSGNTGSASVTVITGDTPFNYLWSNGATTSIVNNAGAGSYTVSVTANGGCSATASVAVTGTGALVPVTSVTPTPCGTSNGVASVNAGTGTYTYAWSNGATTDTISNLAAATYTVTAQGSGCSGTASAVVNSSRGGITIQAPPLCLGDTSQICAPVGYQTYQWNTGSTATCISVSQDGDYNVTVNDNNGCTDTSNHLHIIAHRPIAPVITISGDTLHAHGPFAFQWYFNNAILTGETSATTIATTPGNYYVVQTDTNGCVETSSVQNIKGTTGIEGLSVVGEIAVYPNPISNGGWHLDVSELWIGGWCDIYDEAARLVYHNQIMNQKSQILLNVASGVYFMHINSAGRLKVVKLVKL